MFSIVSALPGFSAAHNERLLIYVLLRLALLAGWGLDELTDDAPAPPRAAGRCSPPQRAIFLVPIVWMVAAGTLDLPGLGAAR